MHEQLSKIEGFLKSIGDNKNYQNIDNLTNYYTDIFTNEIIAPHLSFKIEKIYKSFYLRNPGKQDRGNSCYHLTLKLKSDDIIWLDSLYESLLNRLIKFYKHLFSKIDNYYISFKTVQLQKYETILSDIEKEVAKFLEYTANREIVAKRKKLSEQNLSKIPFGGLFYIAHLKNIKSILELGILSHNLAHNSGIVTFDISNHQVNERRNRIEPSLGGNIHDFAPLFIHPKNPTFFYWCKHVNRENLILLRVNPHILLADNVAFSDGNAAIRTTQFYKNIDDFNKLNWSVIKDNYWTNHPDGTRIKCSEVLVHEKIPLYYIDDIFVYSEITLEKILPLFPNHKGLKTSINKQLYF